MHLMSFVDLCYRPKKWEERVMGPVRAEILPNSRMSQLIAVFLSLA